MELDLFNKIVADCKQRKPVLFGLGHDRILSNEEIENFENTFQIALPPKYKDFTLQYGGGYFGYANIYSLDNQSDFYIIKHNATPFEKFLRIADNGCGDYYMLRIESQNCLEQLYFFEHDTKRICATEYNDIFEYLIKVGLKLEIDK